MIQILSKGDGIELMKNIPDKSIDMLFTDPPYGMTRNKWDCDIDLEAFFTEARRVISDNGVIALWGAAPFSYKAAMFASDIFRYEWIVEKTSAKRFLNANKAPMRAHESVIIFYKKQPVYNPVKTSGHPRCVRRNLNNYRLQQGSEIPYDSSERYPRDVVRFAWDTQKSKLHPTQKPLSACMYFIETYTDPGMLILDPFMGSNTTGLASKELDRAFIGFEKDPDIFDISVRRLYEI